MTPPATIRTVKEDEQRLLEAIARQDLARYDNVRELFVGVGLNHKRAVSILHKWADKGWYDYGVAIDLGWLTEDGYRAADEHLPPPQAEPENHVLGTLTI